MPPWLKIQEFKCCAFKSSSAARSRVQMLRVQGFKCFAFKGSKVQRFQSSKFKQLSFNFSLVFLRVLSASVVINLQGLDHFGHSAIRNPQSAIRNPTSAIRHPQSDIRNPTSKTFINLQQFFFQNFYFRQVFLQHKRLKQQEREVQ